MQAQLAKYGATGVAIAAILLAGVLAQGLLKLSGNHIDHNTMAIQEQTKVTSKLEGTIGNNTRVIEQFIHNCSQ